MNNIFNFGTLSNFEIKKILGKTRFFAGVFGLDQFINFFKNLRFFSSMSKLSFIVNYDNIGEVGTHWICIIVDKGLVYNIDSYGLPPKTEIIQVLKSRGLEIYSNTEQYQSFDQEWCGWFCIDFVLEFSRGKNVLDILTQFLPREYSKNENLLKKKYFR